MHCRLPPLSSQRPRPLTNIPLPGLPLWPLLAGMQVTWEPATTLGDQPGECCGAAKGYNPKQAMCCRDYTIVPGFSTFNGGACCKTEGFNTLTQRCTPSGERERAVAAAVTAAAGADTDAALHRHATGVADGAATAGQVMAGRRGQGAPTAAGCMC